MLKSIMLSAALLLCGQTMSASIFTVERNNNSAPVEISFQNQISTEIIKILLEQHAAPYWSLTAAQSWDLYYAHEIVITELEVGTFFRITYNDGILDVLIDPSSN